MKSSHTSQGFTLIELMITVAIIAILAAIAYPSYQNYLVRDNRSVAQSAMLDIANRQQQIFISDRIYVPLTGPPETKNLNYTLPPEVAGRYNAALAIDNNATPPTFTITFTPVAGSIQAGQPALTLNQAGVKRPVKEWEK